MSTIRNSRNSRSCIPFPEVNCIPGNEFSEFSKFRISRLEPEYLNTFQKTLIYLLIDWPFNFLPVFNARPLHTMGDGGVERSLSGCDLWSSYKCSRSSF